MRKKQTKKTPLVCGYYHNIPSNEFYWFLSTGVKYCITTANNIERDKSTCPSFLQFHFTLTDFISHYPLLSVSLAFSLLKVSSMFPSTCICITWNALLILIQLTPWHKSLGLKDTSWDGAFLDHSILDRAATQLLSITVQNFNYFYRH